MYLMHNTEALIRIVYICLCTCMHPNCGMRPKKVQAYKQQWGRPQKSAYSAATTRTVLHTLRTSTRDQVRPACALTTCHWRHAFGNVPSQTERQAPMSGPTIEGATFFAQRSLLGVAAVSHSTSHLKLTILCSRKSATGSTYRSKHEKLQ